jgi:hypothetical protein
MGSAAATTNINRIPGGDMAEWGNFAEALSMGAGWQGAEKGSRKWVAEMGRGNGSRMRAWEAAWKAKKGSKKSYCPS